MEKHQIVDFQFAADACVLWVLLDRVPTDAWVGYLDGALDDELHRVRPAITDGERVYLRVDGADECDALTLLAAYVKTANCTTASGSRARRKRVRPPLRDH